MSNTADPQAARPAWKDVSYGSVGPSLRLSHPCEADTRFFYRLQVHLV